MAHEPRGTVKTPRSFIPEGLRARIADLRGRGLYEGWPNAHRTIFIHIPKTAGTSVTTALFGSASRHVPYFEYQRTNPRKFARFFKFAFVRNPWDRLVSTYCFLKAGGLNDSDQQWAAENLGAYHNFELFVEGWLNEDSIWSWVHFKPQHHFICDANLRVKMDFVGRMETIAADFRHVSRRLGIEDRLEHTNQTNHLHYSRYYTDRMRERVATIYRADIATFGYSFLGHAP